VLATNNRLAATPVLLTDYNRNYWRKSITRSA